ncbi:probable Probable ATP-dependent RNA helicase DHR2 [Saccharomycodes ludwigii]|uniref:RNA helicase n=1 Tax=Saccharomycodes ludwigii TaxID=36035 RepID=A0A376B8C2_9ASCO|nr:probable Probable ATP-dependent RNA helicase DHR2 [Saccharomycodes ludwigii]
MKSKSIIDHSKKKKKKFNPLAPIQSKKLEPKVINFHGNGINTEYDDDDYENYTYNLSKKQLKEEAEKLLIQRKSLPVYQNKDEILKYISENTVVVLIGETGSGKSTQIPQFLMDLPFSENNNRNAVSKPKIAVTQPRRVAAINLATRVSKEYGCRVGEEVGYSVRFDNKSSNNKTRLKYLTDGMLLRELMLDSKLSHYNYIIIDEAHERTILTDLLLGFLKQLITCERKNNLKIIVMSATLQAEKFSDFFNKAPILFVQGRTYPVEKYYIANSNNNSRDNHSDVVESMIRSIVQINNGEPLGGDILCFLPGQEEIDKACNLLNKISPLIHKYSKTPQIVALPLYAALPPNKQTQVFLPLSEKKQFKRKVILATNIAETSVTIPGIKYVIDSGLRKVKVWRHQLGLSTLLTVPISKASCSQRAGRAGRESAGKCFRLFNEQDYGKLPIQNEPEIIRCDITNPILMLKKIGVKDVVNWTWLENPGKSSIIYGLQELYELGGLNENGEITKKGSEMALLPLSPHLSNVILEACVSHCLDSVLDIVACLSVENLMLNPAVERRDEINEKRLSLCHRGSQYGDLIMMKELYDMYNSLKTSAEKDQWCQELCISSRGFKNVLKIREQLKGYMRKIGYKLDGEEEKQQQNLSDTKRILKCFLHGYIKNTAIGMPDRSYRTTATGETISIHPSSLLFLNKNCPAILYTEYVFTTKGYARNVSRIELSWLQDVALVARKSK